MKKLIIGGMTLLCALFSTSNLGAWSMRSAGSKPALKSIGGVLTPRAGGDLSISNSLTVNKEIWVGSSSILRDNGGGDFEFSENGGNTWTDVGSGGGASSLADLTDVAVVAYGAGRLLLGDGASGYDDQAMTGDVTINSSGVTSVSDDSHNHTTFSGNLSVNNNLSANGIFYVGDKSALRDNGGGDLEFSEDYGSTWTDVGTGAGGASQWTDQGTYLEPADGIESLSGVGNLTINGSIYAPATQWIGGYDETLADTYYIEDQKMIGNMTISTNTTTSGWVPVFDTTSSAVTAKIWHHTGWDVDDYDIDIELTTTAVTSVAGTAYDLLLNFNESDGSTTFNDESSNNFSFTAVGNAQTDTAQKKFGAASLLLDNIGDWITLADNSTFWNPMHTTTGAYTVDFFVRFNSVGADIVWAYEEDASNLVKFHYEGSWFFRCDEAGTPIVSITTSDTPSAATWYHYACIRVGDEYGVYKDGTQIGYGQDTSTTTLTGGTYYIGSGPSGDNPFDGWIDAFKLHESNYFSAAPNATPNDTITVPASEPSVGGAGSSTSGYYLKGIYTNSDNDGTNSTGCYISDKSEDYVAITFQQYRVDTTVWDPTKYYYRVVLTKRK